MIKELVYGQGAKAKEAARFLSSISEGSKNEGLAAIAKALRSNMDQIIKENQKDLAAGEEKGLNKALLNRLMLDQQRIEDMALGIEAIISLPDPIGEIVSMWARPNGLQIGKMRVPLGVVGIIYESRPNVTVDAAALCIKTGNSVILRGGSEAINSNKAIANTIREAVHSIGLPIDTVQLIETTDREAVNVMLKMNQYLDVLIPRGGAGLIQNVLQNATVPVIETGVGNCHVYVDQGADLKMAKEIVLNSKTQRPGVCNAAETLLVHSEEAAVFLPEVAKELLELGVELYGCPKTQAIVKETQEASEEDWIVEYLDLILAVKVVEDIEEAIDHISKYGTKHSEAIVTKDYARSRQFLQKVDAAAVYVNASTRFTDGFEFGFGAEMGISTQKLHARGPMGANELTTFKYIIYGDGQIRS